MGGRSVFEGGWRGLTWRATVSASGGEATRDRLGAYMIDHLYRDC